MKRPAQSSAESKRKLESYKLMVEAAKTYRESFEDTWAECMEVYDHEHYWAENGVDKGGVDRPTRDTYSVNMIHAAVNAMEASTTIQLPQFSVRPESSEYTEQAFLRQQLINSRWEQLDFQRPVRLAFKDSLIVGHGWNKLTWHFDAAATPVTDEEIASELAARIMAADLMQSRGPLEGKESVHEDDKTPRTRLNINVDQPRLEYVSYLHMLIDPMATHMNDARWVAQQIYLPKHEAVQREIWDPEARDNLRSADTVGMNGPSDADVTSGLSAAEDDEYVEIIEFYDMRFGTMCQFSPDGDRFLYPPIVTPTPRDQPFYQIRSTERGGRFYPMSEPQVSKSQQYAMDKIRTEQLRSLQWYRRQYLAMQGLKKDHDIQEAIEGNSPDTIIYIPDDLWERALDAGGQVLLPMPSPTIPADFYAMGPRVQEDFERSYGVTENFLGGQGNPYTSATADSIANAGQQLRGSIKTGSLEQYIAKIGEAMLDYYAAMQSGRGEIPVAERDYELAQMFASASGLEATNGQMPVDVQSQAFVSEQDPGFIPYTRGDLGPFDGNFRFKVTVSAKPPQTELQRRKEALDMLNGLVPLAQVLVQQGVQFNWAKIAEYYFRQGFNIEDVGQWVTQAQQQAVAPDVQSAIREGDPARGQAGAPPRPGVNAGDPAAIVQGMTGAVG